jgi:TorA maturation chaperone TorD
MELLRALGTLAEPPGPATQRLAALLDLGAAPTAAEFTELFALQLYPYASVYAGAEGMLGGDARDRIAGFWRALGEVPPAEPDHLAVLLALYARLAELAAAEGDDARRDGLDRARATLLWEHLLSWLAPWLDKASEIAPPAYRAWAALLDRALLAEAARTAPPALLPLHLREAPPLPAAEDPDFDAALLAAVRSGLVLTRADLARTARELGLGVRFGERRFILKALREQDPAAVAGWLAAEARRCTARHAARRETLGAVAAFWTARAGATAAVLEARPAHAGAGA